MSRLILIVGIVAFSVLLPSLAGDEYSKVIASKRVALEDELRVLQDRLGATHPEVVALKQRIDGLQAHAAENERINPKGLVVVFSKEKIVATLKDARIRSLGGRAFIVGVAVEDPNNLTRPILLGSTMWIPVSDVTQLIECAAPKQK